MANAPVVATLKCPNCGATLKLAASVTAFACAYCGAQQVVARDGGIISLRLISESVGQIQVNTDKTASELALQRLGVELRELEGRKLNILTDQNAEREKAKAERNKTTVGIVVLYSLLWIMLFWICGLSALSFLAACSVTIIISVFRRMSRNNLAQQDEKLIHDRFAPQLDAISSQIASVQNQIARHRAIIDPQAASHTAAAPVTTSTPTRQSSAAMRKPRTKKIWLIPLLIVVICVAWVLPVVPIVVGSALILTFTAYFFRRTRSTPWFILQMKPGRQWANGIKLASCVLLGIILLINGIQVAIAHAQKARMARELAAVDAAYQRKIDDANQQAGNLLKEANTACQNGNLTLAIAKLEEARNVPYAQLQNMTLLPQVRTKIATAQVNIIMSEAVQALQNGDITTAKAKVDAAMALREATNLNEVKNIDAAIRNATDLQVLIKTINDLPSDTFAQLQSGGPLPAGLVSGYTALDEKTAELVRQHLPEITAARERVQQEKLAAAEKARQEAADRKIQAQAAAREAAARARGEDPRFEKGMGDTLTVGYTSYCVWRAEWSEDLSSNEFINKRANAKWLFIKLTVQNNDNQARVIPPLKLVDDRGREYESSSETAMIDNSIGILTTLNPDVSKQGYVVFDVPPNRTYRLKVAGGYWSSQNGYIRIEPK